MIYKKELFKQNNFSLDDLEQNRYTQCKKLRVSQLRIKPFQDTASHKKFGQARPPEESQIHAVYKKMLKNKGLCQNNTNNKLKKWHNKPR